MKPSFLVEVDELERSLVVSEAKFVRFALEQDALNGMLEKNPNFSHDTMASVLKGFRDFAEKKEVLEQQVDLGRVCKAAFEGDVKRVTEWTEKKAKSTTTTTTTLEKTRVSPLGAAVMGNQLQCAQLLKDVCNKDEPDAEGLSPLQRADKEGLKVFS